MKSFLVSLFAGLGAILAASATQGCLIVWVDEPEMPKCMIEK